MIGVNYLSSFIKNLTNTGFYVFLGIFTRRMLFSVIAFRFPFVCHCLRGMWSSSGPWLISTYYRLTPKPWISLVSVLGTFHDWISAGIVGR
jgi:hypothetical protein